MLCCKTCPQGLLLTPPAFCSAAETTPFGNAGSTIPCLAFAEAGSLAWTSRYKPGCPSGWVDGNEGHVGQVSLPLLG